MWLANFANDASSVVRLRSSPWHIPCQSYGRLSIVVHYPSVSSRAAQSGLQSAPACRMRWVSTISLEVTTNPSNIANIRLLSVSGHTHGAKVRNYLGAQYGVRRWFTNNQKFILLKFRKWININLLVYKYTYYVVYGQQDYFRWNLPATL